MKWLPLAVLCCQAVAADVSRTLPPPYTPPSQSEIIRIWGHPELRDVAARWADTYVARHPDIRVVTNFTGSDIAMAGLYTGQADLALLGRHATAAEIQAFEWVYQYKPSSLPILNGSVDTPGRSAALSVLVHESNPLESLRMSQLDALFSYQARDTANSIASWGDLGLDDAWRNAPVRLYSLDTATGTGRYLRQAALGGTRHLDWDRLREFKADISPGEPASAIANRQLLNALKQDRFGLAVAIAENRMFGVKSVPLQAREGCEPVSASPESIRSRSYPLSRQVIAYFNRPGGQETDPVLADFLAFVRGPGQDLIKPGDGYVALSPAAGKRHCRDRQE